MTMPDPNRRRQSTINPVALGRTIENIVGEISRSLAVSKNTTLCGACGCLLILDESCPACYATLLAAET